MGSKPILQTKSKDSSGGRAAGEKARASVVRLHFFTLHGVSSSIGRALVCGAEGSGIVTRLTPKKVR